MWLAILEEIDNENCDEIARLPIVGSNPTIRGVKTANTGM
jgi:hypothetical protein